MKLHEARKYANEIIKAISPYCETGYCKIAGSIRREKSNIDHDIEIVCIPKLINVQDGLFDTKEVRDQGFTDYLDSLPKISGDAKEGKQVKRVLACGLQLDLYVADKINWGYIFAIRTGSAEFSKKVLAYGWKKNHFFGDGGYLRNPGGSICPVETEEKMFELIGEEFIPPRYRL